MMERTGSLSQELLATFIICMLEVKRKKNALMKKMQLHSFKGRYAPFPRSQKIAKLIMDATRLQTKFSKFKDRNSIVDKVNLSFP